MKVGKALVGSVRVPDSRDEIWRDLQLRFLRRTLGGEDGFSYVEHSLSADSCGSPAVVKGLNALLARFREDDEHAYHVILTRDVLPFQPGWLDKLSRRLDGDAIADRCKWAAIVKTDQLEHWPSASLFLARSEFLKAKDNEFFYEVSTRRNLNGCLTRTVTVAPDVDCRTNRPLSLFRSNCHNRHPILGGIYGGMFYVHGDSADAMQSRSITLGDWDSIMPRYSHVVVERTMWREISLNPLVFINHLAGTSIPLPLDQ